MRPPILSCMFRSLLLMLMAVVLCGFIIVCLSAFGFTNELNIVDASKGRQRTLMLEQEALSVSEFSHQIGSNNRVLKNNSQVEAPPHKVQRDWHDYAAMMRDARRVGLGEQGVAAALNDKQPPASLVKHMSLKYGFNALLSDVISTKRSLPDTRPKACRQKRYLPKLPSVSVILTYYNEYFSVVVRSLHSLVKRTPRRLLKQIILVEDYSTESTFKYAQLANYCAQHFGSLVQFLRLPQHMGLIAARLEGAKSATAEVLVFFDSHIEVNYNWLPPLLEPIVRNKRAAVCPTIDYIDPQTFEYRAQDGGARGAFDWQFNYKRLPLLPKSLLRPTEPFENPVMAGGLFAIARSFFWHIGGYDAGLQFWGGEQYELSFKIWQCGGVLYDAPCSHVGHVFRGPRLADYKLQPTDFVERNYKRVAEVWMDEYKDYLYAHGGGVYETIDAGNLSAQHALRRRLKCNSFNWYMEHVAFDLVLVYPPAKPALLTRSLCLLMLAILNVLVLLCRCVCSSRRRRKF